MRQRYIVYHHGGAIGWVHAHNPVAAINRVAAIHRQARRQAIRPHLVFPRRLRLPEWMPEVVFGAAF